MDIGLIVSFAGVLVAGLAGILGVWMERDHDSPKVWAFIFSGLIVVASGVEANNTYGDTTEAAETDARMAVVLEAMAELAEKGDNPALQQFVGAELAVQARANPEVVKKMEKSIAKKGGDPEKVKQTAAAGRRMAAGLPASKPKAGERPTLRTPGSGRASGGVMGRGKAGGGMMGRGKAGGPGGMTGRGKAGGGMGMGAGVGKAAGGKAGVGAAGPAAGRALGAAGPGAGKAAKAAGGATDRAKAGAKAAGAAADDAAKATDDAKKAADDTKKAADDAKKEADKAKEDAKKKIPGGLGR
ncbi:MAG: hypothetical protein H6742_03700 [Alphaproteobacteria bacterium]|nr:hypothetical protein [Alphaproteobacteria bacterium]